MKTKECECGCGGECECECCYSGSESNGNESSNGYGKLVANDSNGWYFYTENETYEIEEYLTGTKVPTVMYSITNKSTNKVVATLNHWWKVLDFIGRLE